MKREARLANLRERHPALRATAVAHDYDLSARVSLERNDFHFFATAQGVAEHLRLPSGEALPVRRLEQWAFNTGRRHLEHVALAQRSIGVEPRFERARCARTIVHRDRLSVTPLDMNVD